MYGPTPGTEVAKIEKAKKDEREAIEEEGNRRLRAGDCHTPAFPAEASVKGPNDA